MVNKYNEFILEKLILESKLEYSKGFYNILKSINNKISNELLKLKGIDNSFTQNYIDLSNTNDEISFIPDRKAQELIGSNTNIKYTVLENIGSKHLHHRKKENGEYVNKTIFNALGFTPVEDPEIPRSGDVGIIKSEVISNLSGKTFCWFIGDNGLEIIANKDALQPYDETVTKLWNTNRNNIKIGRLTRSLLNTVGVTVTDRELSDFVNLFKSTYDLMNEALLKFELVRNKDIAHWYSDDNYESQTSTLGNSCMASVDSEYFDIYVYNPKVCGLLILYSDGGEIVDGKYKSDKIKGRALVWTTDQGDIFMDRIYYINDSDVDLYKQYAIKNNWWCKKSQNSTQHCAVQKGTSEKSPIYTVTLESYDFNSYPYFDTMAFMNTQKSIISNDPSEISADRDMTSTEGGYNDLDSDNDED